MQLNLLREYFSVSGTFDPGRALIYSLILIALSSLVAITYYYLRLSQEKEQVMMFLVKPKSNNDLEKLRQTFAKMDKTVRLTLLQYQPLV